MADPIAACKPSTPNQQIGATLFNTLVVGKCGRIALDPVKLLI
jgi:hypothetical protein